MQATRSFIICIHRKCATNPDKQREQKKERKEESQVFHYAVVIYRLLQSKMAIILTEDYQLPMHNGKKRLRTSMSWVAYGHVTKVKKTIHLHLALSSPLSLSTRT